jgi:hypothetical protein
MACRGFIHDEILSNSERANNRRQIKIEDIAMKNGEEKATLGDLTTSKMKRRMWYRGVGMAALPPPVISTGYTHHSNMLVSLAAIQQ